MKPPLDRIGGGRKRVVTFRGDGVPWSLALVLLPEPPLAIDQVDLLEVELELVLMDRYKQVVGLGSATDQSAMGDLLDAVALGAGHGMHLFYRRTFNWDIRKSRYLALRVHI